MEGIPVDPGSLILRFRVPGNGEELPGLLLDMAIGDRIWKSGLRREMAAIGVAAYGARGQLFQAWAGTPIPAIRGSVENCMNAEI